MEENLERDQKTILVVDDDMAILDMVGSILGKDGHVVAKINRPLDLNMDKFCPHCRFLF